LQQVCWNQQSLENEKRKTTPQKNSKRQNRRTKNNELSVKLENGRSFKTPMTLAMALSVAR